MNETLSIERCGWGGWQITINEIGFFFTMSDKEFVERFGPLLKTSTERIEAEALNE